MKYVKYDYYPLAIGPHTRDVVAEVEDEEAVRLIANKGFIETDVDGVPIEP